MASVTLQGNTVNLNSDLPTIGSQAPDFVLTAQDLSDKTLKDFAGKKKILNIVPSLDTGTCALSTKKFNEKIAQYENTIVLVISADLPFAQDRFCKTEGTDKVITLSMMRSRTFAENYGVLIVDGPLKGIASRAVVVLDESDKVIYTELVSEIVNEPDYDKALEAVK